MLGIAIGLLSHLSSGQEIIMRAGFAKPLGVRIIACRKRVGEPALKYERRSNSARDHNEDADS
jgi:hypothetical protein